MVNEVIKKLPNIDNSELVKYFPKINIDGYPELKHYSWEDCHKGSMGAGDLFLTSELAKKMHLEEGLRILELGAGNCLSAVYLAKKYKVEVIAADLWIDLFIDFICKTDSNKVILNEEAQEYKWVDLGDIDNYELGGFIKSLLVELQNKEESRYKREIFFNY